MALPLAILFADSTLRADPGVMGDQPTFGVTSGSDGALLQDAWLDQLAAAQSNQIDVALAWETFEPKRGEFDHAASARLKQSIETLATKGFRVGLRMAWHYPPKWATDAGGARFIDQYGDRFNDSPGSGKNVVAICFNRQLRDDLAAATAQLFHDLGDQTVAKVAVVTIGGGFYGEINFPDSSYNTHDNCYWAFNVEAKHQFREFLEHKYGDITKLNKSWGTPFFSLDDIEYTPGQASHDHHAAADFLEWLYQEQDTYLLWQRDLLRKYYKGHLAVLCGSWGIRPGQVDAAVAKDLHGDTPGEKNGDIQRGFDYARYFDALKKTGDKKIIVQCTWVDAPESFSGPDNPPPVEWLADIAKKNGFLCSGEFTDSSKAFALGGKRMRENHLAYLIYVPADALFQEPNPLIKDWAGMIKDYHPISSKL